MISADPVIAVGNSRFLGALRRAVHPIFSHPHTCKLINVIVKGRRLRVQHTRKSKICSAKVDDFVVNPQIPLS
jgi:hypothetical protein